MHYGPYESIYSTSIKSAWFLGPLTFIIHTQSQVLGLQTTSLEVIHEGEFQKVFSSWKRYTCIWTNYAFLFTLGSREHLQLNGVCFIHIFHEIIKLLKYWTFKISTSGLDGHRTPTDWVIDYNITFHKPKNQLKVMCWLCCQNHTIITCRPSNTDIRWNLQEGYDLAARLAHNHNKIARVLHLPWVDE